MSRATDTWDNVATAGCNVPESVVLMAVDGHFYV